MRHINPTRRGFSQISANTKNAFNTNTRQKSRQRCFGTSVCKLQQSESSSDDKTTSYKSANPLQFPWLLSTEPPRIKDYPYIKAQADWAFLNILPFKMQHYLSQWLGHRMLQLNMGDTYFPDQFLVGASLGTRKALENISEFLTHPSDASMNKVNELIAPALGHALLGKAEGSFAVHDDISIDIPQIYDARVRDIWVTLGNKDALENPRQYDIIRWMTMVVSIKKSNVDELEEPFADYRKRLGKGLMEGAHVAVDVEIDAEVRYQVTRPTTPIEHQLKEDGSLGNNTTDDAEREVVLFDQGRRTLLVRFESPYFAPAHAMVSGRDEYTGEPMNDWKWRISDIDQLVEKQNLDGDNNSHIDD